jgi:hypothetical protein
MSHAKPNIEVAVKFLTTLFESTDKILFRPMETWTAAGQKKSRVAYNEVCYRDAQPLPLELAMGQLLILQRQLLFPCGGVSLMLMGW